jgi:hypothetical protein
MTSFRDYLPLYERVSDYIFNMSALTRGEARQQWRDSIKEAWYNRCAYCGKPPIDDASLTIDHVKPKSKGGQDCTSNVIPACTDCNSAKASSDWLAWYSIQDFYSVEGEWRIRQWLSDGRGYFGRYDQEDACKVDDYINSIYNKNWPTGSAE